MTIRRKKLIKFPLQMRLVATFLAIACAAALFQVFLLNRSIMSLVADLPKEGEIVLNQLPTLLLINLGLTFAVLFPIMVMVGIAVTHRIAGPVYRFEQHLDAIARGEHPGECRIRTNDELHDLCEKINRAVARLREDAEVAERMRKRTGKTPGTGTRAA